MVAKLVLVAFSALAVLSPSLAHPPLRSRATQIKRASPVTLPFVRRSNATGTSIVKNDQARAKFLRTQPSSDSGDFAQRAAKTKSACINIGITNAGVSYLIDVRIPFDELCAPNANLFVGLGHRGRPSATLLSHCGHGKFQYLGRSSSTLRSWP